MNILQSVHYYYPRIGGMQKYVKKLSNLLTDKKYHIEIITSKHDSYLDRESIEPEGKILRYKPNLTILRNPISISMLLNNKLRISKYDVVHLHGFHSFQSIVLTLLANMNNIPIVVTCHGNVVFGSKLKDWLENKYTNVIGSLILKNAKYIIVLSNTEKKRLLRLGVKSNKIKIIPNGFDVAEWKRYYKPKLMNYLSEKYKLNNKKIVLFVGSIIPRKGVNYLINAMFKVKQKYNNVVCVIVGDGEWKSYITKLTKKLKIENSVIFTGLLQGEYLVTMYHLSDVYVLPSHSEGLPTTILESLASGCPVVASDIDGVSDHFKNCALLCPPRDHNMLADLIIKILNNKTLRDTLTNNGYKLMKEHFSWQKHVNEIEKIYKNINLNGF